MKKLSDYGIDTNRIYMFLKFSDKKYLEMLRDGNLHMRNLKYYINREEKEGDKGIGDKYEATQVINELDFEIVDPETQEVLLNGKAGRATFRDEEALKKPVFCMTGINSEMLKVIDETDKFIETVISVGGEEENARIIKEFGEYVMTIAPDPFMNSIAERFSELQYRCTAGFIKYDDLGVNNMNRLKDFATPNIFFWKDKAYKHQNEYRIVIHNENIEEPIDINIGKLRGFSKIVKAEELFQGKYTIRFPKVKV